MVEATGVNSEALVVSSKEVDYSWEGNFMVEVAGANFEALVVSSKAVDYSWEAASMA